MDGDGFKIEITWRRMSFRELVPSRATKTTLFRPFSEYDCVSEITTVKHVIEFETEHSASNFIEHYTKNLIKV